MVPNAMAKRVAAGNHPTTASPEDWPSGRRRTEAALCVEADGVAGNDYDRVGGRAGDFVDDALQDGEPQRKDDGIGALQRVAVVDGDDRSSTDLRRHRSCRLSVHAREPQGLAA